MSRFIIFLVFGPLIGYVAFIVAMGLPSGSLMKFLPTVIAGALFAYVIGLLPALAAAVADWLLKGRHIVITTLIGAASSAMPMLPSYMKFYDQKSLLSVAAFGAIAAALCSWLSQGWHEAVSNLHSAVSASRAGGVHYGHPDEGITGSKPLNRPLHGHEFYLLSF